MTRVYECFRRQIMKKNILNLCVNFYLYPLTNLNHQVILINSVKSLPPRHCEFEYRHELKLMHVRQPSSWLTEGWQLYPGDARYGHLDVPLPLKKLALRYCQIQTKMFIFVSVLCYSQHTSRVRYSSLSNTHQSNCIFPPLN